MNTIHIVDFFDFDPTKSASLMDCPFAFLEFWSTLSARRKVIGKGTDLKVLDSHEVAGTIILLPDT